MKSSLVFDADFVPRPEFLLELVPYMDDPTVGIVQSPQFFDTHKQMNWIQRCAGSTQELFYRFIQPSRDALGAAVCVGTSALYRRTALDAIGGFPKIGQSEDIYTGLWMHDAGYSTRYVPVTVSKGVAPSNLDNFIAQQYRWCEGSMTMLANRRFHTTPNLSLPARLCYWSGFLYYVSTALSSLIIPLPAIVMAWFFPQWVRPWNTDLAGWCARRLAGRLPAGNARSVAGRGAAYPNCLRLRPRFQHCPPYPEPGLRMAPDRFQSARTHSGQGQAILHHIPRFGVDRGRRRSDCCVPAEDGFTLFAGMLVFFLFNLYVVGPLVVTGIGDEFRSRRQAAAARIVAEEPIMVTV